MLSLEGNKKSRAADVSSSSRSRWPTREPKPSANFHLSAAPRSRSLTPRKPFFLFRDQTLSLSASPFPPLSLSLDLKQFSQFPTGKPKRKKTMTIISAKVSSSSPAAAAARPSKVIAIDAATPRAAAERLTFYPVLTARSRPRAWLPKLGLGGPAAAPRGGAGASAARAKTIADFLVGAPPVSQPPSSAAAAEC